MSRKSQTITLILLLSFCNLFGQGFKFKPERMFVGGNLGASFGSITYVDISPLVGYRFTDRLMAGVGGTYIYLKTNFQGFQNYETNIYGGRVFGRFYITESIFTHVEQEFLNGNFYEPTQRFQINRRTIYNTYVGAGYQSAIGMNSGAYILVLYNLNQTYYSKQLYPNPIIRIGFNIGL